MNTVKAITHSLIEGDNLDFLTRDLLTPTLVGEVDLLYLDPPYNTQNSIEKTGFTYDDATSTTEWLKFMRERLLLSKPLLKKTGVIAISIDDSEVHQLRVLLDEIYGRKNFIAQLVIDGGNPKNNANFFSISHEYMIMYANSKTTLLKGKIKWRTHRDGIEILLNKYEELKKKHTDNHSEISRVLKAWVRTQPLTTRLKVFYNSDSRGLYTYADLSTPGKGKQYNVLHPTTGKPCQVPSRGWGITSEQMGKLIEDDMVIFGVDETSQPMKKLYLQNKKDQLRNGILSYPSRSSTHLLEKLLGKRNSFSHPKNLQLMKDVIEYVTPDDGLVVDLFAGSGTTGHAVLELNETVEESQRSFVLVTTNENNIFRDVTEPRIMKVLEGAKPFLKTRIKPTVIVRKVSSQEIKPIS